MGFSTTFWLRKTFKNWLEIILKVLNLSSYDLHGYSGDYCFYLRQKHFENIYLLSGKYGNTRKDEYLTLKVS